MSKTIRKRCRVVFKTGQGSWDWSSWDWILFGKTGEVGLWVGFGIGLCGQAVADQRNGQTLSELIFFMNEEGNSPAEAKGVRTVGFIALGLTPAGGPARRREAAAEPAVCQTSDGARVASPQSPILRRSKGSVARTRERTTGEGQKSGFENSRCPVLLTTTVRFCSHRDTKIEPGFG